jgi:hypothetical protein
VAAVVVVFCHDIEEEGFHVVVQSFRAEEELREKTQILAVYRVLSAVDLKERVLAIAIDLVAWRVLRGAFELQSH